jgi:hypothetical protein
MGAEDSADGLAEPAGERKSGVEVAGEKVRSGGLADGEEEVRAA